MTALNEKEVNMVGRTYEIELLREIAAEDRSRFVVVYGRRRVGKTFLIREAFDYRFAFSHTGMENASLADQLEAFYDSLVDQGLDPSTAAPRNWIQAFGLLKRLLKSVQDRRKIVFIDELPWMDTPRAKFVSALENFWNGWCSARKDIVLIVCGSATSWMIKKVLKNKGGLFNRANRVLCLNPFTLGECEALMKERGLSMERKEVVEGYMIFGGAPYYWSLLERSKTLAQSVDRLCFAQGGELTAEFKRLYASVFNRAETHLKVVEALASRRYGLSRDEIVTAVGLQDSGKLSVVLEELEESGFIRVYAPFGRVKRGSLYQLMDAFTIFYFTFMKGRSSARAGYWLEAVGSQERLAWEGVSFERVCLWHEKEIKAALGIAGVSTNVCSWRSSRREGGAQIDLLLDRRDGVVNVCEMKFCKGEYSISASYARELENKLALLQEETRIKKSLHLTLVTVSGVKRNENSHLVQSQVGLDDLFR